ncbi:hypothetical protein D3C78_1925430 [compost metagenome]
MNQSLMHAVVHRTFPSDLDVSGYIVIAGGPLGTGGRLVVNVVIWVRIRFPVAVD